MEDVMVHNFIVGFALIVSLIFLLKIWNLMVRNYNNNILSNSTCDNCGSALGSKSLTEAIQRWEIDKQRMKEEKTMPSILLSDMSLICPKCGKRNSEQELYRRNREKRNK